MTGTAGVGKTALLLKFIHELAASKPEMTIIYLHEDLSSLEFEDEVTFCSRLAKSPIFHGLRSIGQQIGLDNPSKCGFISRLFHKLTTEYSNWCLVFDRANYDAIGASSSSTTTDDFLSAIQTDPSRGQHIIMSYKVCDVTKIAAGSHSDLNLRHLNIEPFTSDEAIEYLWSTRSSSLPIQRKFNYNDINDNSSNNNNNSSNNNNNSSNNNNNGNDILLNPFNLPPPSSYSSTSTSDNMTYITTTTTTTTATRSSLSTNNTPMISLSPPTSPRRRIRSRSTTSTRSTAARPKRSLSVKSSLSTRSTRSSRSMSTTAPDPPIPRYRPFYSSPSFSNSSSNSNRIPKDFRAPAQELATLVGHIPLALTQIISYIQVHGISIKSFLRVWARTKEPYHHFLSMYGPDDYHSNRTCVSAYNLLYREFACSVVGSPVVLKLALFFHHEDIPCSMFGFLGQNLEAEAQRAYVSFAQWGFGSLRAGTMPINANNTDANAPSETRDLFFSFNPLFSNLIREGLTHCCATEVSKFATYAIRTLRLNWKFSYQDQRTWPRAKFLLRHAETLCKHALDLNVELNSVAYFYNLSGLAGYHQHVTANLPLALSYSKKSIQIKKDQGGEQSGDFATCLSNLASIYRRMGEYRIAIELSKRASILIARNLGADHQNYAMSLSNLAGLYELLGDYSEALALFEKARFLCALNQGVHHSDYAISLNNLAGLHEGMGNYSKAFPLYYESLAIKKATFSDQHQEYATCLNNLGGLYESVGDLEKALPLYRKATAIDEVVFGPNHVGTASALNNLAFLHKALGLYQESIPLYTRSLEIRAKDLGQQHPLYSTTLNNLGMAWASLGDYSRAFSMCKQSLEITRAGLGEKHNRYASCLANLAQCYVATGHYDQALPLTLQALDLRMSLYPRSHPVHSITQVSLADLYLKRGEYSNALAVIEEANRLMRSNTEARGHPRLARCAQVYAQVAAALGSRRHAYQLFLIAGKIKIEKLGLAHPQTAELFHELAAFYFQQHKLEREYDEAALAGSLSEEQRVRAMTLLPDILRDPSPAPLGSPWVEPKPLPRRLFELGPKQSMTVEEVIQAGLNEFYDSSDVIARAYPSTVEQLPAETRAHLERADAILSGSSENPLVDLDSLLSGINTHPELRQNDRKTENDQGADEPLMNNTNDEHNDNNDDDEHIDDDDDDDDELQDMEGKRSKAAFRAQAEAAMNSVLERSACKKRKASISASEAPKSSKAVCAGAMDSVAGRSNHPVVGSLSKPYLQAPSAESLNQANRPATGPHGHCSHTTTSSEASTSELNYLLCPTNSPVSAISLTSTWSKLQLSKQLAIHALSVRKEKLLPTHPGIGDTTRLLQELEGYIAANYSG